MINNIAIIGCGWLGLPLGKKLVEEDYNVHGSTTSEGKIDELSKAGIKPFVIKLSENAIKGPIDEFLTNVTILIINVPPRLRGDNNENYVSKMTLVLEALKKSQVSKIIFVSSTSVYGNASSKVTEETLPQPNTESGRQLLASENIIKSRSSFETTIIRFGGLIGPKRHPINMLSGRKGLKNGNHPVNLIHLNDCIEVIASVIKNRWWGELFNAVYPLHPTKKEYYQQEAIKKGLILPEYEQNIVKSGKEITSYRLINVKKYIFKTTI